MSPSHLGSHLDSKIGKRVAVLQSNYLPWKGYFHLIQKVDEFIFYDDVQFTKNDWRNRNRIKTRDGVSWLSIPVGTDLNRLICEVKLPQDQWQITHWDRLKAAYSAAPCFKKYQSFFEHVYLEKTWTLLSELNQYLIQYIAKDLLGIRGCTFGSSLSYRLQGIRQTRLMDLLRQVGAAAYLSGPAGRAYLDPTSFAHEGITLEYMDYSKYLPYEQLYPPFVHEVSIVDLLFQKGEESGHFIWN